MENEGSQGNEIEYPCKVCEGTGRRQYSTAEEWQGPRYEVSFVDVCDQCWGTGDALRTGWNLRKAARLSQVAFRLLLLCTCISKPTELEIQMQVLDLQSAVCGTLEQYNPAKLFPCYRCGGNAQFEKARIGDKEFGEVILKVRCLSCGVSRAAQGDFNRFENLNECLSFLAKKLVADWNRLCKETCEGKVLRSPQHSSRDLPSYTPDYPICDQ